MEKKLQKPYLTNYNLFMAQDLWQAHHQILLINLAERIHKIKCKCGHDNKKCETSGITYNDCENCLQCKNAKANLIEYKSLCFIKNY